MVGNYITSFVGILPIDNPEVVLYVAIDNPKGITAYGGTVAAPIAKTIMEDIITALEIAPSNEGVKKEYRYYETKYITIPNIIGMTPKEAREQLSNLNIEYSGTGNTIISTSPKVGSSVKINSTIRLMLG